VPQIGCLALCLGYLTNFYVQICNFRNPFTFNYRIYVHRSWGNGQILYHFSYLRCSLRFFKSGTPVCRKI